MSGKFLIAAWLMIAGTVSAAHNPIDSFIRERFRVEATMDCVNTTGAVA